MIKKPYDLFHTLYDNPFWCAHHFKKLLIMQLEKNHLPRKQVSNLAMERLN